jgi:hypothetical protein
MKGIGFAFHAIGQWSEHDRSKIKWRMKVRIEWWPSMASQPKIGGRPVSHPIFKAKPDAHRMYAQDQVVIHTVRM